VLETCSLHYYKWVFNILLRKIGDLNLKSVTFWWLPWPKIKIGDFLRTSVTSVTGRHPDNGGRLGHETWHKAECFNENFAKKRNRNNNKEEPESSFWELDANCQAQVILLYYSTRVAIYNSGIRHISCSLASADVFIENIDICKHNLTQNICYFITISVFSVAWIIIRHWKKNWFNLWTFSCDNLS